MKNKPKIMLIIITLLLLVGFGIFVYCRKNLDVDNKPVVNNNIDEKDSQDEANNEASEDQNTSEEQEQEIVSPVEQEEQKSEESNSNSSTTNSNNKNNSNSSISQNNKPVVKEEPKNEENPVVTNSPVTEKTVWEKLGISEYDYYHSPVIKGQTVTYSTRKACIDEGNAKALESDDLQFGCTEVISYSGDTLGYMLIIR